MIELSQDGGIRTIKLAHGKASPMDIDLLQAIGEALDAADQAENVDAIVITGTASVFSAGVDLKQILDGGKEYAYRFIPLLDETLEKAFAFSKPAVAAVNGHAIAGGCILALACDYTLMATGNGRIGIPELKVGVPFPASAFEIVRFSAPKAQVQTWLYRAGTHLPEEALARGFVDELSEPDELLAKAQAVAVELSEIPGESYRISKRMLREPSFEKIVENRKLHGQSILDRWSHEATYAHIRGYLEKTLKK